MSDSKNTEPQSKLTEPDGSMPKATKPEVTTEESIKPEADSLQKAQLERESVKPSKADDSDFDAKQVFKRLTAYLTRHRKMMLVAVVLMMATAGIEAYFARMVNIIVNEGFVNASEWHLKWLAPIFLGLMVLRAILGFCANYAMTKLGRYVTYDIRQDIFSNLITLPTTFFDQNSSSKNVSKLIYDVEATSTATTDALTIIFKDAVAAIVLTCYLFYLDWRLTLIFVISMPFLVIITRYTNKRFRKISKEIQDSMGGIADTVKEASIGQKVIKVYGGQEQELENFTKANKFNLRQNLKRALVSSAIVPITVLVVAPAMAIILYVFLNYLRTGPESAGNFVAYITACMMLTSNSKRLAKVNEKVQNGITAANSVFRVIDSESEKNTGTNELDVTKGHLKFNDVTFSYSEEDPNLAVLKDISFEVKPGKRVALVGPSGSGKSTITSLILRFYKQQKGAISLDGLDINDITLASLRDQVALVSQETTLFDDTIARNIMYGMLDDYDEERLNAAIKAAHVDNFIKDLPDGLDTVVGEHGLRLSGGQRQRIAIARAIYKDAPILILDEATSALDNKSERYVQDALETLMKGRTSLVIAHRLTTIESADEIFVLEGGKIVERGSHKALIKKSGAYSDLHRAQSKNKKGFFFWNRS